MVGQYADDLGGRSLVADSRWAESIEVRQGEQHASPPAARPASALSDASQDLRRYSDTAVALLPRSTGPDWRRSPSRRPTLGLHRNPPRRSAPQRAGRHARPTGRRARRGWRPRPSATCRAPVRARRRREHVPDVETATPHQHHRRFVNGRLSGRRRSRSRSRRRLCREVRDASVER
jgi:hypothetical protein